LYLIGLEDGTLREAEVLGHPDISTESQMLLGEQERSVVINTLNWLSIIRMVAFLKKIAMVTILILPKDN